MQLKKGNNRIVFVFPRLKFVIKFPIINIFNTLRILVGYVKVGNWGFFKKEFEYNVETYHSVKYYLFRGIHANWKEFVFYQKTHNPFLQQTFFSFFGFVNIQKCDEVCTLKEVDMWVQLYRITSGYVFEDSHHFSNPNNFSFREGKLCIHDYGSMGSQRVISRYGLTILENFNPSFNYEDEKKKK